MLDQGSYYHIYNRGVDASKIFLNNKDFKQFFSRYKYYLCLSVDTYAYCLLNNHFHLLVRVISEEEQKQKINSVGPVSDNKTYYQIPNPDDKIFKTSTLIGHWLNSYSKYFNRKYNRSGPAWDGRFKRRLVESEEYLTHLICYIHRNPIHHGISSNFNNYSFSSYSKILKMESDLLACNKVLEIFGGKENYIAAHQEIKTHFDLTNYFENDAGTSATS